MTVNQAANGNTPRLAVMGENRIGMRKMMRHEPRHEPRQLPGVFGSWQEWRQAYQSHMDDYLCGYIDRMRARVLLVLLGFTAFEATDELDYWLDLKNRANKK